MYASVLDASLWLYHRSSAFRADESGASTVEMVIGMAGAITLGLSVTDMVSRGVENLATDISEHLSNFEISTSFDDDPQPGE